MAKKSIRTARAATPAKYELPGGATRSEQALPYHLIPTTGLRRIAERFALGAAKHGERNWELSLESKEDAHALAVEAYNHLQEHLLLMLDGTEDDHLGAIGWAVCILSAVEKQYNCRWTDL